MTTEEKEKILIKYKPLIAKLCYNARVYGYTKEELIQEMLTNIFLKLDNYDSRKSKLSTYIHSVTNNKLKDLVKSPKNVREIPFSKIYTNEEDTHTALEKITLELAFEMLREEEHKEAFVDILKGYTLQEVGDKYGLSKSKLHREYQSFLEKVKQAL